MGHIQLTMSPPAHNHLQCSFICFIAAFSATRVCVCVASSAACASLCVCVCPYTVCKRVLPGPAAAQRAAAAASHKQRPAAEAAIVSAVADLLHVLGALKAWAPLMAGPALVKLIDMIVKLYSLHQPLVNRHTSEVLAAVAGSKASHLSTGQLAQLLGLLIDGEAGQLLSGGLVDIVITSN